MDRVERGGGRGKEGELTTSRRRRRESLDSVESIEVGGARALDETDVRACFGEGAGACCAYACGGGM